MWDTGSSKRPEGLRRVEEEEDRAQISLVKQDPRSMSPWPKGGRDRKRNEV